MFKKSFDGMLDVDLFINMDNMYRAYQDIVLGIIYKVVFDVFLVGYTGLLQKGPTSFTGAVAMGW